MHHFLHDHRIAFGVAIIITSMIATPLLEYLFEHLEQRRRRRWVDSQKRKYPNIATWMEYWNYGGHFPLDD